MKSKRKDNLSDADLAYKEELDTLVRQLIESRLEDAAAQPILQLLVEHATRSGGNITSVPKALQFLIEHKAALYDLYSAHMSGTGDDSYSVVLLLELMSFLDAIATPDDATEDQKKPAKEADKFKLMLYKVEAVMAARRMLANPATPAEVREKIASRKIQDWGNEYLTSLSTQIVAFFNLPETRDVYDSLPRSSDQMDVVAAEKQSVLQKFDTALLIPETLKFAEEITDYFFQNGFEYDAIDLLLEVDLIESIRRKCGNDHDLITRVTSYIISISAFGATYVETRRMLVVAYEMLLEAGRSAEALRIALKLDDQEKVRDVIFGCTNAATRRQLAYICASHGKYLSLAEKGGAESVLTPEDLDEIRGISSGEHLSGFFLILATELDVIEPKAPQDIFRSYPATKLNANFNITDGRLSKNMAFDSALGNLSHTFVNAFVNCGFGTDMLINVPDSDWVFHHFEYGLLCAAASVGLISLWNVEEGLSKVDKYEYSSNPYVKAGSYAAYGISSCNVVPESDPLSGLLLDKLETPDKTLCLGAVLGVAFGYAGTQRESLLEYLVPIVVSDETQYPHECSAMAAVALGLIFVGSGRQEASEAIVQKLLDLPDNTMDMPAKCQFACALGILQLGRMDASEVVIEALKAVEGEHGRIAELMVEACAYAGSGDVIRIQQFLKCCASAENEPKAKEAKQDADDAMEVDIPPKSPKQSAIDAAVSAVKNASETGGHDTKKEVKPARVGFKLDDDTSSAKRSVVNQSSVAILGIALTALGDSVGCAMLLRLFEHPLAFGSPCERRAVPLALALAYASNPSPQVIDALSKLTHDVDYYVSMHAIFALGIVGAGTNNARIAIKLQNLARSHTRDTTVTFIIRIAAGLLHMGKGTTTISPLHSEGLLLRKTALAGLLVTMTAALDMKNTFTHSMPFTLLFVAPAIRPRWMLTLLPNLEHVQVPCRVGNMVETTGTVGKQRRISGFQTHQTPVLVGASERAELATEEYVPCTTVLEGIVIVEKNDNVTMD
ncbi:proteasome 26S regulatory subunit, putative [Babesia bigemina]|uniref:Proteasome 26S regulatory subunit, putative n=1 Tax=Babesia bigemina TaxID=5866 RepID=A0A061D1D1_BABBI|nr:proteasome 26S regulatory subunit, putative [Babesia bigemina]CDR94443.1 proteasome 26S regulatory subunit, putative [Babesia bigemina]|eukprot:XP_012766629.1 proteasome 26S regulatory subunit, putative [Babesia bigemina]